MMKKRLKSCLEEARIQAKVLPSKNGFTDYGALVYFVPSQSNSLPVHLVLDTFASKPIPLEDGTTDDFVFLTEGEILGEVSDCYEEIKSFILDCGKTYEGKLTVFIEDLLAMLHGLFINKNVLSVEDIITVLESSSEDGDFALWDFDIGVGFRIAEKIA